MVKLVKKPLCTGCSACYNICRAKAITMDRDQEGFIYPRINESLCINCGLCKKVCPVLYAPHSSTAYSVPDVYATWNLDLETRFTSTSGGFFSALATYIFEQDGYVVGARYNAKHLVEHCIVHTKKDLELVRQSKYVESTIGNTFYEIKHLLQCDNIVLFCGTPCQNAGLRSFLGKEYSNLYCCDFICRGVNSSKAYEKYLLYLQQIYASDIERVWFKNKTVGWNQFGTMVTFKNGQIYYQDRYQDLFMKGYLQYNLYCRPSCHHCHFKGKNRVADITFGDFWGIGHKSPKLDDNKGTSVVMIRTPKGRLLFHSIKDYLFYEKRDLQDALDSSQWLLSSIKRGGNRKQFFRHIDQNSFDQLMFKYGKNTWKERFFAFSRKTYNLLGLHIIKKKLVNLFIHPRYQ